MKEKIERFLKDNNFLPINKWNSFEIIHRTVPPKKTQKREDLKKIKKLLSNKGGLYVYKKGKKILYIGQGTHLFNRIRDHYERAYQKGGAEDKNHTWHKFWNSHIGEGRIKVYWKELEDKEIRKIIEQILTYILRPEFKPFSLLIKILKLNKKDELDVHSDPIVSQFIKQEDAYKPQTKESTSLEDHRNKANRETKELLDKLREEILKLGDDIKEGYAPNYIKYSVDTNFLAIHVRKRWLILELKVNEKTFSDPKKLTRNTPWKGWKRVKIQDINEFDYISELIRQAYKYQHK